MSERTIVLFNLICGMGLWLFFLKFILPPCLDHFVDSVYRMIWEKDENKKGYK